MEEPEYTLGPKTALDGVKHAKRQAERAEELGNTDVSIIFEKLAVQYASYYLLMAGNEAPPIDRVISIKQDCK